MTNFERGEKLIREAEEYLEEVLRAYARGSWNIVVRRSQETVELSLKGLLRLMGVEYPKVHDPGEFVAEVLEKKRIELDEKTKEDLKRISVDLAEKRAPAFYFEQEYSEQEAKEAKEGAGFVMRVVRDLAARLRSSG